VRKEVKRLDVEHDVTREPTDPRSAVGGTQKWRLVVSGYGGEDSSDRLDAAEEGFHGPVAT
jgi:hypothetical protein